MGPLALLALGLGGAGLASVMKKKGIDLKKKEKKKVVKEIVKKKKKYKPEWQTEPDTKKLEEQKERSKKNKKRFLDKLESLMN
jgi:hypothetical protein